MNIAKGAVAPKLNGVRQQLAQRWAGLAARERYGLGRRAAAGRLACGLESADPARLEQRPHRAGQLDQLEGQLQDVQRIAAESRELRGAAPVSASQAAAALKAATNGSDSGKITLLGDRASLTLTNASPEGCAPGSTKPAARHARGPWSAAAAQAAGYSGSVTVKLRGTP